MTEPLRTESVATPGQGIIQQLIIITCIFLIVVLSLLFPLREGSTRFSKFTKGNLHYPADRYLCLEGRRVAILGDSQMNQVAIRLSKILGNCTRTRLGSRCGETRSYLGLSDIPSGEYTHPGPSEGPVIHGLQNLGSGCRDCKGCDAKLFVCRDGIHHTTIEYIAVEFARDVSLQSSAYSTTQENVGLYLSKQNVSYVVYNTGLHDTALKDASSKSYERNLIWYSGVLKKFLPLATFLWVDTMPVVKTKQPDKWKGVTHNDIISGYNKVASRIAHDLGHQRISPFGILQLPYFSTMTADGVHYSKDGGVFYDMLAADILLHFCK